MKSFQRCLKAVGLARIRFHDLRHDYATLSLAAGADLAEIRDALGHSTISLTANTYAHVLERGRERGAERLEAFVMGS